MEGFVDRSLSVRLDSGVLDEMERVLKTRRISKRRFLEEAIRRSARQLREEAQPDVWTQTLGAWKRRETPEATVQRARTAFRQAFDRHRTP